MAASLSHADVLAIEQKRFDEAIGSDTDSVVLVLRAQLYSESLLERLIRVRLPRGDRIIENGSLTYAQKLWLADSLDCMDDSIVSSLRNLNRLRNQCAHELGRTIGEADVVRIGSSLGKRFTEMRIQAKNDATETLRNLVSHLCGYMVGLCHALEGTIDLAQQSGTPGHQEQQGEANGRDA